MGSIMPTAISPIRTPTRTKRGSLMVGLVFAYRLGVIAEAQQPSAPHYAPPPVWPGEQALSSAPANRYVFVSPERDAVIIRVPPDWAHANGKPEIVRYELHNRLRPSIVAQMTIGSSGWYVYNYTVVNDRSAKDAIQLWELIIPATGDQPGLPKISGSDGWNGGHSYPPIIRQVELPDQPLGRVVTWVQDETDRLLAPGRSQTGFRIESSCKPGFTTALFGSGTIPSIDQEYPNEIFTQLDFYNDPTWKFVPALTFGPMFCGETPRAVIVQDMISGIKRSIETGRIKSTSEFAREALAKLNTQLADNNSAAPAITNPPSGEFEGEIFTALQLSLSFRIAPR